MIFVIGSMVESVDTPDLKSVEHCARGSSSLPTPIGQFSGTIAQISARNIYFIIIG